MKRHKFEEELRRMNLMTAVEFGQITPAQALHERQKERAEELRELREHVRLEQTDQDSETKSGAA